jgi:DNA invertase Pin-like site-specific DNA recombinase
LLERLEALKPGDVLCIAGLEALRMEAAEAASLIAELLARGVHVLLTQPDNTLLDLGSSDRDAQLASAFAELLPRRKSALDSLKADASRALLTAAEIEDVRRLSKAGLSPRRIGLIYRRSPKCISDILWGREPGTPEPWMTRRHKTS